MNIVETTPLTEVQRATLRMPSIQSQMPIRFRNGARLDTFNGTCSQCGQTLHMGHLHGSVVMHNGDSMAEVIAMGKCSPCNLFVPFRYRVYQDMRFAGFNQQGVWSEWKMRLTPKGQFKKWVRWLFSF